MLAFPYFGKVGFLSKWEKREEEIKSKHNTSKTDNNIPRVEGDSFGEPPVLIWELVHLQ